jgi:short chain dehydrogenase
MNRQHITAWCRSPEGNRMSINWLAGMSPQMADPMTEQMGRPMTEQMGGPMAQPMAMPVFAGQKLIVVGGSSGIGRQTAADVVAAGGSAVVIGLDDGRVNDTAAELSRHGKAYGIAADLTDRAEVERVRRQLAVDHADAMLLVNAAGLFIPKPFLDHDAADYDSYLELDAAQLRRLPPARPDRHRPGHGQCHHVPAVSRDQLGHRRHLGRRRWRHGRT